MNKHHFARPRVSGFTLTELLVVISLAALLGAMVLPSLNTASDTAKAAVCLGNMHEWGMAMGNVLRRLERILPSRRHRWYTH